jgi:hypothetical protein
MLEGKRNFVRIKNNGESVGMFVVFSVGSVTPLSKSSGTIQLNYATQPAILRNHQPEQS